MENIQFGSGVLFSVRNGVANATPRRHLMQEISVDFKGEIKTLTGRKQLPLKTKRGKVTVSGKAKLLSTNLLALNDMFFGQTPTTGIVVYAEDEAGTVPGTGPFTVQPTNHTTFKDDLGVFNASTGSPLVKVASAPATGQYSVDASTGTYTFASADTGVAVKLNYSYSSTTRGTTINLTNQAMGVAPENKMFLFNNDPQDGTAVGMVLNACVCESVSLPTKQDDYWMLDVSFNAHTDSADNLGAIYAD